ncbi:uncharacterized protein EV420DRAFT_1577905 [Desarmillaria tabescens]|uniref:Uncharacterized protein n=1 Tax=Armillaria tabescens TaxID=1929756 RepID=A0AA39JLL9_ARMTA|nr:uncharacterized protein EV420DRAFT_1577905 [Desarmillaria tabescens]KAK0442693.1 hypothetical protein EV420DRAFT_1577905 [Desarmillaria tabescens]
MTAPVQPYYTVTVRSPTLYPHIFIFDASTLQIEPIYSNMASSKGDRNVETRLGKGGDTITFGLSRGMVKPLMFGLPAGQNVDVTFIKIFVTTETVDFRCISQSAFEDGVERIAVRDRPADAIPEVWASMTIPVVVKSANSSK